MRGLDALLRGASAAEDQALPSLDFNQLLQLIKLLLAEPSHTEFEPGIRVLTCCPGSDLQLDKCFTKLNQITVFSFAVPLLHATERTYKSIKNDN